jgi:FeS assembly protein IscX
MPPTITWTDIEEIAEELDQQHPDYDLLTLRFTDLRKMVEELPNFEPRPDQHVNERILEAIQAEWMTLRQEREDEVD